MITFKIRPPIKGIVHQAVKSICPWCNNSHFIFKDHPSTYCIHCQAFIAVPSEIWNGKDKGRFNYHTTGWPINDGKMMNRYLNSIK